MGFFGGYDHSEDITIDVSPLAERVDKVTRSVQGTTGAVVSMESAVILQEKESADEICRNVNYGFYSLITSQISQKLAIQKNAADSRLALMTSLGRKIKEVQLTAEKDYNRISRRYIDTFKALDKNLKNRITELNKPAVQLSEKKKSLIFKSMTKNVATAICYEKESLPVSQMFINAELKKHANSALESLSNTMAEEKDYDSKMRPIMCRGEVPQGQALGQEPGGARGVRPHAGGSAGAAGTGGLWGDRPPHRRTPRRRGPSFHHCKKEVTPSYG